MTAFYEYIKKKTMPDYYRGRGIDREKITELCFEATKIYELASLLSIKERNNYESLQLIAAKKGLLDMFEKQWDQYADLIDYERNTRSLQEHIQEALTVAAKTIMNYRGGGPCKSLREVLDPSEQDQEGCGLAHKKKREGRACAETSNNSQEGPPMGEPLFGRKI